MCKNHTIVQGLLHHTLHVFDLKRIVASLTALFKLQAHARRRVHYGPLFLCPTPLLRPGPVAHFEDHGNGGGVLGGGILFENRIL